MGSSCCSMRETIEELLEMYYNKIPLKNESSIKVNDILVDLGTKDIIIEKMNPEEDDNLKIFKLESKSTFSKTKRNSFKRDRCLSILLSESNFRHFIYKYLFVPDFEDETLVYFNNVYAMINHNLRYPIIKIIMILLLCAKDNERDDILIENISYYNLVNGKFNNNMIIKNHKYIETESLKTILKYYIKAITNVTIDPILKSLLKEKYNNDEKEYYLYLWSDNIINLYINAKFKNETVDGVVNKFDILIERFVKIYSDLLFNQLELIKDLNSFSLNYKDNKEMNTKLSYKFKYN